MDSVDGYTQLYYFQCKAEAKCGQDKKYLDGGGITASLLLNTHQSITNSREVQWQELYSKLFSQYRYRTKLIKVDGAPKFCK